MGKGGHPGHHVRGSFHDREQPLHSVGMRDFNHRAFTIGIGGPVGSGKTALMLQLCRSLRDNYNISAITNDIFTQEDGEFLIRNHALEEDRIRAIETGGCPHAAIREDISANLGACEELSATFGCDMILVESGGDNLAANYSRELADYIIYVIDVSGGDKIPRKGGPGITQSDLLIINKTDLATAVGADLEVMERDAGKIRTGGPTVFAQVKFGKGLEEIMKEILHAYGHATGNSSSSSSSSPSSGDVSSSSSTATPTPPQNHSHNHSHSHSHSHTYTHTEKETEKEKEREKEEEEEEEEEGNLESEKKRQKVIAEAE